MVSAHPWLTGNRIRVVVVGHNTGKRGFLSKKSGMPTRSKYLLWLEENLVPSSLAKSEFGLSGPSKDLGSQGEQLRSLTDRSSGIKSRWKLKGLRRSGNDLLTDGVEYQFRRFVQVELLHDVGAVGLDRVRAQIQQRRDFLVGFSLSQQLQHLFFAFGQQIVGVLKPLLL